MWRDDLDKPAYQGMFTSEQAGLYLDELQRYGCSVEYSRYIPFDDSEETVRKILKDSLEASGLDKSEIIEMELENAIGHYNRSDPITHILGQTGLGRKVLIKYKDKRPGSELAREGFGTAVVEHDDVFVWWSKAILEGEKDIKGRVYISTIRNSDWESTSGFSNEYAIQVYSLYEALKRQISDRKEGKRSSFDVIPFDEKPFMWPDSRKLVQFLKSLKNTRVAANPRGQISHVRKLPHKHKPRLLECLDIKPSGR